MQLPVAAYRQRLRRLAADFAATLHGSDTPAEAAAVLEALQAFLYGRCGFRVASYGATALPSGATVDHPGVWEKAGHAYLNEVLVSRVGEWPWPPQPPTCPPAAAPSTAADSCAAAAIPPRWHAVCAAACAAAATLRCGQSAARAGPAKFQPLSPLPSSFGSGAAERAWLHEPTAMMLPCCRCLLQAPPRPLPSCSLTSCGSCSWR